MKSTAFAVWMNRIAPVMDVAGTICVVESDGSPDSDRKLTSLPFEHPAETALLLRKMGVETLVCGAVSNGMLQLLNAQGIRVIAFISGDLETVMVAWFEGRLPDGALMMPGCGRFGRLGPGCGGNGRRPGLTECSCVCTSCGHREPHVRGIPCVHRQCPKCGADMKRK